MPAKPKTGVTLFSKQQPAKPVGRPKGAKDTTPRKANEVREIAQGYTVRVMKRLFDIAMSDVNLAASVAASKVLLERGHGSITQVHANDPDNPLPPAVQVVFVQAPEQQDTRPLPLLDGKAEPVDPQLAPGERPPRPTWDEDDNE